jgi:molybdopterin-guanine dinucleotide biosynthesis protein B
MWHPDGLWPMKLVHIVGRRNHGKTTLIVDLVTEFTGRGVRVGTIKHSSHVHELDTPGKDSFLHRQAGAVPAAIVAGELAAVFMPRPEQPYETLAPLYADTDLVLVEGDVAGPGPSVEVHRAEADSTPLAGERDDIAAVVSDDDLDLTVPVWALSDIPTVADRVLELIAS